MKNVFLKKDLRLRKFFSLQSCVLIFIGVAFFVGLFQIIFLACSYGIDFTDEGYYLTQLKNPFEYSFSVTQFGFIYHPIYLLVGDNIALLRQINVFITFVLSAALTWSLIHSHRDVVKLSNFQSLTLSFMVGLGGLVIFQLFLITPNYNTLTFQGLLLTTTGLALTERHFFFRNIWSVLFIALGGVLVFLSKPTSGLFLAVLVTLFLLLARADKKYLIFSGLLSLIIFVAFALLVDGSLFQFIRRLQTGAIFAHYLSSNYSFFELLRFDDFQFNQQEKYIFNGLLLVATASLLLVSARVIWVQLLGYAVVMVAGFTLCLILTSYWKNYEFGQFRGLLIFALVFAAAIASVVVALIAKQFSLSLRAIGMLIILISLPYIFAFGTNNNYWQAEGWAGFLWLLAGFYSLLVLPKSLRMLVVYATLSLMLVIYLLTPGVKNPYRQPQALYLNSVSLSVGSPHNKLVLSEGYAKYIKDFLNVKSKVGLKSATPIIDLTGQSPGVLYFLDAINVGNAWMIGGYPGSLRRAEATLLLVPCEKLVNSWLLIEPNGPRSISLDVLSGLGMNFDSEYSLAGEWYTAAGVGGYSEPRLQRLYKPSSNSNALKRCNQLRLVIQ